MSCAYTRITQEYDGDGQRLKQTENGAEAPLYYVRSSVLGGAVVMELSRKNGVWLKDIYVYAIGSIIAQQKRNYNAADEVRWNYMNPVTGSQRGAVQTEIDPLGTDAGFYPPQPNPPIMTESGLMNPGRYADAFEGRFGCTIDGAPSSCDVAFSLLGSGAGVRCPNNDCNPRVFQVRGVDGIVRNVMSRPFSAGADGRSGFWVSVWQSITVRNDDGTIESQDKPGIIDWIFKEVEGNNDCQAALNQAGKTEGGLREAQKALGTINGIVNDINISRLLAAIGIQETDFQNIPQGGGGPGRGIFQIEPKAYGITEDEANNLESAVNAIANKWSQQWSDILSALDNAGYNTQESAAQYWALAGLARIHNRWRPGVVYNQKGKNVLGSLMKQGIAKTDFTVLDNTGRKYDKTVSETANGTYVRNVLDIFFKCLGG